MHGSSSQINSEVAQYFRNELRAAREEILRDSEAFEHIILVFESLGRLLCAGGEGLGNFRENLQVLAHESPLAEKIPATYPQYHLSFATLFELVRDGRNTAIHEGALARHLTVHAVEMGLILEDALMLSANTASEYMVRAPVTALLWQPLSFVRQTMLANSFSHLPIQLEEGGQSHWKLVSDASIARYLRSATSQRERGRRLREPLQEAIRKGSVSLASPRCCAPGETIAELLKDDDPLPVLVVSGKNQELIGILTAFDLL